MNITQLNKRWFFEEDDGGGSGGSSVADLLGPVGGDAKDPNDGADTDTTGITTPTDTPTPAPSPTLDAAAFAKEFGAVLGQHLASVPQGQPQGTKQAPPTPEQIAQARKDLKFWNASPEFLAKFGNLETQGAAFDELRDGLTTQMVTIVQALLQDQEAKFNERLTPMQQMVQQREETERASRFDTTYKELANPELRDFLGSISAKLHAAGEFKNLSEAQAFEKIAKTAEKVIQVTNPQFKLSAGNPAVKKPATTSNRGIAATTPGGGSGGAGGGDEKPSGVPKAVSLFPQIRG